MMEFGGRLDAHLLNGEPGHSDRDDFEDDTHVGCETCGEMLCLGEREICIGGCCQDAGAVGFSYDGHPFCEGACSDDMRALIAEDIAAHTLALVNFYAESDRIADERAEAAHDRRRFGDDTFVVRAGR